MTKGRLSVSLSLFFWRALSSVRACNRLGFPTTTSPFFKVISPAAAGRTSLAAKETMPHRQRTVAILLICRIFLSVPARSMSLGTINDTTREQERHVIRFVTLARAANGCDSMGRPEGQSGVRRTLPLRETVPSRGPVGVA